MTDADPPSNTAPAAPDSHDDTRAPRPAEAEDLRQGVQKQREHMQDVTGRDPLAAGLDD